MIMLALHMSLICSIKFVKMFRADIGPAYNFFATTDTFVASYC